MALSPALKKMVSTAANKYKSGNAGDITKPKDGRNTYRLICEGEFVPASGQFWADLGVNWIKADENGKPLAVIGDCDTVYQTPSVVGAAIEMAVTSAIDEESKKLYEGWRARKSILLNAIDRASGDNIVLELTPTTFAKVLDQINLYSDAGADITLSQGGSDIVITRAGKALNTTYDVAIAPAIPGKPFADVTAEQTAKAGNLMEFIEAKFFRGEEQKALNFIQQISGVAVPRLEGGTARTPTAALASPAASVPDATVAAQAEAAKAAELAAAVKAAALAAAVAQKAALAAAETPAAPVVDAVAVKRAEMEARKAARQAEDDAEAAALAELEAAEAATITTAAVTTAEAGSSLSDEETDAVLAELDSLFEGK